MVGSFEVGRFVMCVVHDIHDKVIMYCMACAICIAGGLFSVEPTIIL